MNARRSRTLSGRSVAAPTIGDARATRPRVRGACRRSGGRSGRLDSRSTGRLVATDTTRSPWKPGSTDITLTKLRMRSRPGASRTTAHANCSVTRRARASRRCRRARAGAARRFLQGVARSRRADSNAGSRPQMSVAASGDRDVNASTRPSSAISLRARQARAIEVSSAARSDPGEREPAGGAERPRARRSRRSISRIDACASGAERRADRHLARAPAARVSIRHAMSAHAISSSTPTAASSTTSTRWTPPATSSCIGMAIAVTAESGFAQLRRVHVGDDLAAIAAASAPACSRVSRPPSAGRSPSCCTCCRTRPVRSA